MRFLYTSYLNIFFPLRYSAVGLIFKCSAPLTISILHEAGFIAIVVLSEPRSLITVTTGDLFS